MTWRALALIAAAGCTTSPEPYPVEAVAQLVPLAAAAPGDAPIDGAIEVLGTGMPRGAGIDPVRTIAAYHVRLPEGAAPWVRLYAGSSCDIPQDAAMLDQDLGTIRRVGDETHFFARDVEIGGHIVDIDTETATADVSFEPATLQYLFDLIAVVQAPADDGRTVILPSTGSPVPAGGPWLACGVFTRP